MSEEEKKVIDYFNADVEYLEEGLKNSNYIGRFVTIQDKEVRYLKTILNLIEKQNKKIENAIKFIEDGNNYFEDGENWENVLKIKDILEGTDE